MRLIFKKARAALAPLVGIFMIGGNGCTLVSTGARSAAVVLVLDDGSAASSRAVEMPSGEELKSLLSQHFLWVTNDQRSAQWIAYVKVRPSSNPLQPVELALVEIKKNPYWPPLDGPEPIARRDNGTHPSLKLAEQNQQQEESRGSRAVP